MQNKTCTKCGVEYPRTAKYFKLDKKRKDGLSSWCRRCYRVIWQNRDKEKFCEWRKKYDREYHKTLKGYISKLLNNIKSRCNNPNHNKYKYYGGRGIKCLFNSAELFSWIVKNNIEPRGKHIHRINNDGNYNLNNIEFMDGGLHISLHADIRRQGL